MKPLKPIYYFSVKTGNRGDDAIRYSIVSAIKKQINIPFAFFNVKYDELTESRIINDLNKNASCLMIAGSGLYSNCSTTKSGWYFNCDTSLFTKIKVPIILLGLGCNNNLGKDIFGGELSDKAKESIKLINDLSVISTVRDKRTYDILKEIGITNHKLMLDPACFLSTPKITKEKKIAINLAQHSQLLGRYDCGKEGQNNRNKNIKLFSDISNYLISKHYSVVFICHDALEQSLVIDLKKHVPQLKWLNTDDINVMLKEYASCQFTIAIKMHSCILSFASLTPFINLYYDIKSPEFMKMIYWTQFGQNLFSIDKKWLKNRIDELCKNWLILKTKLNIYKQNSESQFNDLINQICDIIKNENPS